jgi:hypothetical protein
MARDEGRTYEVDIITLPDGRTFSVLVEQATGLALARAGSEPEIIRELLRRALATYGAAGHVICGQMRVGRALRDAPLKGATLWGENGQSRTFAWRAAAEAVLARLEKLEKQALEDAS